MLMIETWENTEAERRVHEVYRSTTEAEGAKEIVGSEGI